MTKTFLVLSLAAGTALMASGYRVPETSMDAVALSAACVANSSGADAAYYNPANMVFNDDANHFEATAIYAHLTPIRFRGYNNNSVDPRYFDTKSEDENFLIPGLHYTSSKLANGMRWGLSLVSPGGLSKRWKSAPGVYTSEEFTLQTVEINPSLAYPVTERFSVAAGLRMLYSSGIVTSTSPAGSRDMDGDGLDFGYNLALSFKATDAMTMSATYRSKIDMDLDGDAKIWGTDDLTAAPFYNGSTEVSVPLPASLNLAVAHTVGTTTIEFNYERTFWSSYKTLDFDYPDAIAPVNAVLEASPFGAAIPKEWKDSNTYRLGFTHVYNEQWTSMAAVAYDETPVPSSSLGFELPDSDAWVVSLGGRYNIDETLSIGGSALASIKGARTVDQGDTGIQGKFTEAAAYLIAIGMEYKF